MFEFDSIIIQSDRSFAVNFKLKHVNKLKTRTDELNLQTSCQQYSHMNDDGDACLFFCCCCRFLLLLSLLLLLLFNKMIIKIENSSKS